LTTPFPEAITRYNEGDLAKLIVKKSMERLSEIVDVDVLIVGAGFAGLTAAWLLALNKFRVLIVDESLRLAGMGGSTPIVLPVALIEEGEAVEIAKDTGIRLYSGLSGIYVVDPSEALLKICVKALDAGANLWLGIKIEDVITRGRGDELRVTGALVNTALPLDDREGTNPLYIWARAVIDATDYECCVVRTLVKKHPEIKLEVPGASSGNVWVGEKEIIEKTGMVVPGLYVAGLSVAELYNANRVGPLIGGLIISGRKVAVQVASDLRAEALGTTSTG